MKLAFKSLNLLIIVCLSLSFTLSGCATKQNAQKENTKQKVTERNETKINKDLDTMLAGGRLGYSGMAVVAGGASNKLWIVDAKYHKILTTIDMGWPKNERTDPKLYPNLHDVHAITFTKDFKVMWTADWFDYNEPSYVIAYDPLTFKEIGRVAAGKGSHHTALSPDDKYLYAANQYGSTVSVIDTKTMKKIKDIPTGKGPDYISPSMYWEGKVINTPYLFVSVDGTNNVTVIDWKKNEAVKDIDVGASQHGVNLSPNGKTAWVAAIGGKDVPVIDVNTLKIIKRVPVDGNPIHIVFSPDSKYAYLTATGDLIYKIDTTTYKTIWKSKGTVIPAHLGVTPDGKEIWTLNHGMDTKRYPYKLGGVEAMGIQIWDSETGKLINEVVSEAMPHEIQFVPYSAFGLVTQPKETAGPGKDVYDKNCASCHGTTGQGTMGPALNTEEWSNVAKVEEVTRKGKGQGMPGYEGKLTDAQIKEVSEYVASLYQVKE